MAGLPATIAAPAQSRQRWGNHMNAVILIVSCANHDEAAGIGRALVDRRLAACVQLRPHHAIYRWQGTVEEAGEIGLLIKTTQTLAEPAISLIRSLHSYALPAILLVPVVAEPATLAWLWQETESPEPAGEPFRQASN
jgi:periplasmic divalent cation tolerance protein